MNKLIFCLILTLANLVLQAHSRTCILDKTRAYAAEDTCKTGKDQVTGRTVYLTTDVEPQCQDGKPALLRKLNKSITFRDSSENEMHSQYMVAFIVEKDGKISGGRVIGDDTNTIGRQILQVVRSLSWLPGKCNGKKVAVLYRLPVTIDLRAQ